MGKLKLSNQAITFFGLHLTIAGYLLLGDWQAIPYDPCTEYSPFHHPEMIQNGSIVIPYEILNKNPTVYNRSLPTLKDVYVSSRAQMTFSDRVVTAKAFPSMKLVCDKTESCPTVPDGDRDLIVHLQFAFDERGNLLQINYDDFTLEPAERLECMQSFSQQTVLCIDIIISNSSIDNPQDSTLAHVESLQVLPDGLYWTARNICMSADVPGRQCHWIPNSLLTKEDCEDCQPICRSLHQILTFPQFILGLALLLLSNSLLWVTIVALIVNQLPGELQVDSTCMLLSSSNEMITACIQYCHNNISKLI